MKAENEMKYNYWLLEALKYIKAYKANRADDTLWGALNCCGACMCEFDRKHALDTTQKIQSFIWEEAFLRGETSYERYYESGYFLEKYEKGA